MADNKRSLKDWARFFLGAYTPPEFILIILRFFSGLAKKALTALVNFIRTHRALSFSLLGVFLVAIAGLWVYRFSESRKPQPIHVDVWLSAPENARDGGEAQPLVLEFYGSAAPVDMVDKEVAEGITLTPSMPGLWRWVGDDVLVFTAERPWSIGKKYSVGFARDFFPPHIRVDSSLSFSIEDFSIWEGEAEFYIDPEDSS
ncbi:MAG: hypothetical protein LBT95_07545, partial [Treponema sp.]|nr:hypothetical protein [Treponema sp.]